MVKSVEQTKEDFNKSMIWFGEKYGKEFQDNLEKVLLGAAMAAMLARGDDEP